MSEPRFLQIHTLVSYPGALLNRDDSGLSKRLPYGGVLRTRISSQCLKRHWRLADDDSAAGGPNPHGMHSIAGSERAIRSRDLVEGRIIADLQKAGIPPQVLKPLQSWFNWLVYSADSKKMPTKIDKAVDTDNKSKRQTLLLGEPELKWLSEQAMSLAQQAIDKAKQDGVTDEQAMSQIAFDLAKEWASGGSKKANEAAKDFKANIKTMRDNAALPGGLTSALFGRMITSDPSANITAPVHVAHAFTVHAEESESDYFTAVDDLSGDEPGADTIQETELNSGLYYGYVVVDLPGLISNLGVAAPELAGPILNNLVHLIAEVSPGAKLGSTAPYSRPGFMLLECGDRQPRSLAEAFRRPAKPDTAKAIETLAAHLQALDDAYDTGEERRYLSTHAAVSACGERCSLDVLGEWTAGIVRRLQ